MKKIQHLLRPRPAIAMIELIFAIVVIGITLLSAPLVLNQAIRSSTVAMQQEAIAAAGSQIGMILTMHWDERDSNATIGYNILNVATGDGELVNGVRDLNTSYSTRRFNTIAGFTDATPPINFGSNIEPQDFNTNDDIDDFDGSSQNLNLYASEIATLTDNQGEYLDTSITMTNTIAYGTDIANYANDPLAFNNPFFTSNTSTNIKLVSVRLTSGSGQEEHNKSIVLSAFACNIGTARANVILLP